MIAIGLACVGCFFSSFSLVLMKHAHNRALAKKMSAFKDPVWYLGFVSLIVGTTFNVWALGYGNQTLLSSTSSFSIIFNSILSVLFLREPLFWQDCVGMFLICVGSTLFLLAAKNDENTPSSNELKETYLRPTSVVFVSHTLRA